jgi:protein gp37
VRKFEKRGGVKVRIPSSLEELFRIGAAELGITVPAVCVREVATEALIKSVDAIDAGAILWVMTQEEESNFD